MLRISKSGDFIILTFESIRTDKVHTVTLPINEKGWRVLIQILSERERSPFVPREYIGMNEAPIQYMVDEWLKKGGSIKKPKIDAPEDLTFDDLDL
jgi:hypothetical protein